MFDLGFVVDVVASVGALSAVFGCAWRCAFDCASGCVIGSEDDEGFGGDELNVLMNTRFDMILELNGIDLNL